MSKTPFLPAPLPLPPHMVAELRRAERVYARGMFVLLLLVLVSGILLRTLTEDATRPAPTPATIDVRGWYDASDRD